LFKGFGFKRLRLFRIAGIDIILDFSWLLIFLLITFSLAFTFLPSFFSTGSPLFLIIFSAFCVTVFMATLLAHELAHSVVARKKGIDVGGIVLYLFGGSARILKEPKQPADEILMAAAGPLTSFFIAAVSYLAYVLLKDLTPEVWFLFYFLALGNLGVGLFNLTPAFPLDGGRLLKSLIWLFLKNRLKATIIAANLSSFIAACLFLFGLYLGFRFEADGLWLSAISLAIFSYSRESIAAAYQNEILDMKLNQLFSLEELKENQVYRYDFDYISTVEISADIKIYDLLKILKETRPMLVSIRTDEERIYLFGENLLDQVFAVLENAQTVLKFTGR